MLADKRLGTGSNFRSGACALGTLVMGGKFRRAIGQVCPYRGRRPMHEAKVGGGESRGKASNDFCLSRNVFELQDCTCSLSSK